MKKILEGKGQKYLRAEGLDRGCRFAVAKESPEAFSAMLDII
ncbi:MAG: hypothetical protein ABIA75_13950 [Candidatus Neomarinimicrobiota bacterium]